MLAKLIEVGLPRIIGVVIHHRETLTKKEQAAKKAFMAKLNVEIRETDKPLIVAMIGLVGSGKSAVAKELAKYLGANVIEADAIRVELREQSESYERTRAIAEDVALKVINQGGNVILDSDFVDVKKRASLREKARKLGARVVFVRAYADYDVMAGRAITADYRDEVGDFFGGALSRWDGVEQSKGAVVKLREMWRRTPLHYRWENKGGGQWVSKNPPCTLLADIDTTNSEEWKRQVEKCAQKLLK